MLCGGRSTRMGRPKAWLPAGGEPMLLRVVRVVAEAVGPVVVVAAPGQDVPELPAGVEVVRDGTGGNGPLQGLAAGLDALRGRAAAALVTGCDYPFLTAAFLRRLCDLRGAADACLPVTEGVPRPLPGVYALGVLGVARELLAAREYRLGALAERVGARLAGSIDFAGVDPGLAALRDVNTPADYARALADLGFPPAEDV